MAVQRTRIYKVLVDEQGGDFSTPLMTIEKLHGNTTLPDTEAAIFGMADGNEAYSELILNFAIETIDTEDNTAVRTAAINCDYLDFCFVHHPSNNNINTVLRRVIPNYIPIPAGEGANVRRLRIQGRYGTTDPTTIEYDVAVTGS